MKRHLKGWKRDAPDHRDLTLKASFFSSLPSEMDLRGLPNFPKTEDQGGQGSCTANGSTSVAEFTIQGGVQLSRAFVYAKTRIYEGGAGAIQEDNGAQIRNAVKMLAVFGAPPESSFPYDERVFNVNPPAILDQEAIKHRALVYFRCPSLKTIKRSLADHFLVTFGFSVPENFMSVNASLFGLCYYPKPTEGFDGGHCVVACGYDDAKKIGGEIGAVLCQNSWGTSWGVDGGFFWLPYRFFVDGLATDAWTIRRSAQ